MMYLVFKYAFNAQIKNEHKQIEEVPTHAVAMVPAEQCTVLLGGGSSWVFHSLPKGTDVYLVDGEIASLPDAEALQCAQDLQKLLIEQGTIATDPRIPPPLEKGKLKLVK